MHLLSLSQYVPHCSCMGVVVAYWCGLTEGVNVLSPNNFGVTGTDAMDVYLTGVVHQSAAA